MAIRFLCRILCVACVLVSARIGAQESLAGDVEAERDARWIPSLALFSTGHVQPRSGSVEARDDTAPPTPLTDLKDVDDTGTLWSIGGSAGLATPVLWEGPGKPRLFFHADVGAFISQEEPVVNEGDPGKPPRVPQKLNGRRPIQGAENLGSATRVQTETLLLGAGAGVSFETTALGRRIQIKPSIEWLWQEDRVRALLGAIELVDEAPDPLLCELPGPALNDPIPGCRTLFIDSTESRGFHSLGPGLELEADAARYKNLLVTVFASTRFYYVLGDRDVQVTQSARWEREDGTPLMRVPETSTLISVYEREPWHYRFGAGIRVHWLPE